MSLKCLMYPMYLMNLIVLKNRMCLKSLKYLMCLMYLKYL
jgi:hypothetical protein